MTRCSSSTNYGSKLNRGLKSFTLLCCWLVCCERVILTQGILGDESKSNLTVLAHDDPYGIIVIASGSQVLHTDSTDKGELLDYY